MDFMSGSGYSSDEQQDSAISSWQPHHHDLLNNNKDKKICNRHNSFQIQLLEAYVAANSRKIKTNSLKPCFSSAFLILIYIISLSLNCCMCQGFSRNAHTQTMIKSDSWVENWVLVLNRSNSGSRTRELKRRSFLLKYVSLAAIKIIKYV